MTYFHASFMFVVVFQQNYGCRIFECLNPTGEIPPGCAALIYWQFAPLEARTYMVSFQRTLLTVSFHQYLLRGATFISTDHSWRHYSVVQWFVHFAKGVKHHVRAAVLQMSSINFQLMAALFHFLLDFLSDCHAD